MPWRWAAGVKICTGLFCVISLECSLYQETMKCPYSSLVGGNVFIQTQCYFRSNFIWPSGISTFTGEAQCGYMQRYLYFRHILPVRPGRPALLKSLTWNTPTVMVFKLLQWDSTDLLNQGITLQKDFFPPILSQRYLSKPTQTAFTSKSYTNRHL